ncbi:pyrroline-5-carboxylate reductase [Helicobacter sp. MIT 14-3879]|uniref:pyrroline-5-carboxylate reductase n=1 Tax=Helicobacter sp. MIT 14-3879 TaxID=2040649 RepID=UPI000E1EB608|nr:pyrroline-5-carboxylate reductase [Helicobacter sp. MIT 14-3879]RDU65031.1 pyrroline-5-carboxylate reductase [Helicobacter sp. MIT 14-3879]
MKKITIIGYGKMAKAIACGLNDKFSIEVAGRNEYKLKSFIKDNNLSNAIIYQANHNSNSENNNDLANNTIDLEGKDVILAIKPYALDSFIYKNKANNLYSIMAGISIEKIKSLIQANEYFRVMPNIASFVGAGVNVIYAKHLDSYKKASEIFSMLGKCIFVDKESLINPAGAISGSGTAYLAIVAEAMIDAGVREGINLDTSKEIVRGLFSGFAKLFENSEANQIKLDTTSPGGTTAEALKILENRAIRSAFIDAIHKANKKAHRIS